MTIDEKPVAGRAGLGAVLPLVVIMLGCVIVFIFATSVTGSTAGRASSRVTDLRMIDTAALSALSESALLVKRLLATPAASGFNWRAELLPPPMGVSKALPRPPPVAPAATRSEYKGFGITVGDVDIGVVRWDFPPVTGAPADFPPYPAQGVIEMSVTCEAKRAYHQVKRTLKQRRIYYVTFTSFPPPTPPDPAKAFYVLEPNPLATVIAP